MVSETVWVGYNTGLERITVRAWGEYWQVHKMNIKLMKFKSIFNRSLLQTLITHHPNQMSNHINWSTPLPKTKKTFTYLVHAPDLIQGSNRYIKYWSLFSSHLLLISLHVSIISLDQSAGGFFFWFFSISKRLTVRSIHLEGAQVGLSTGRISWVLTSFSFFLSFSFVSCILS